MKKHLKTSGYFFFLILALIIYIPTSLYAQKLDKLIIKEKYENAEKYCSKQSGEYQKECYLKLANAYLITKNDYSKAEMFYVKAGKQNEGYLKIGDAYFANKKYEKAAEYYEKAENKDRLKKVADIHFSNGDYDKSIDFYIKAGEADKAVYNKVADDAFANKKYEKAAEYYEKAENKDRLKKLADRHFSSGEYDKSVDLYIKAGETDKAVYNKVADDAFANKKYEKAVEYYEKAENKDWLKKVADIHFSNGEYDKSVDLYIKAGETDKAVYNKVADDAFANKKYEKAAEYYEKAKNKDGQKKVSDKVAFLKKLETIKIGFYSGDGFRIKLTKDYEIQVVNITMYFSDKGITEDSFKSVPIDESFNFSCYKKNVGHGNVTREYNAEMGALGTTIHFSYAEQWDINIEGNINGQFITGKIIIFENGKPTKVANWEAKYRY